MMSDKQKWEEIPRETEELCDFHGDAICNYRKCREFNNHAATLLQKAEELGYSKISNKLMFVLLNCSPRVASTCEVSGHVRRLLEELRNITREMHSK
mgnify:CR=1 FL=1